jgi:hypothetical protein
MSDEIWIWYVVGFESKHRGSPSSCVWAVSLDRLRALVTPMMDLPRPMDGRSGLGDDSGLWFVDQARGISFHNLHEKSGLVKSTAIYSDPS